MLTLSVDDATIRKTINNVLETILDNSQDTPKNVQHNNAQNAVLFEAINLAIHLDTESVVVAKAAVLLGRFILSRETNVRYLGLDTMAHLAACAESLEPIKMHQDTIILSLRDKDISVRRRGLDLLYSMCDVTNAKVVVAELLRYLHVADYALREEMVLKIAILTEKVSQAAHESQCAALTHCCSSPPSTRGTSTRSCSSSALRATMSARRCGTASCRS
jgi:AP-2 complex subunit alpha